MTDPQPASSPAQTNSVSPARGATQAPRSRIKGDVPPAMLDRYLVERDRSGRAERYFRDHRATEPLFRDRGGSLVSTRAYPDAVADMLKIARHRGWVQVKVSGDERFRREVWIQAQALGLEVKGHRPTERDRQAAQPDRPGPASHPARGPRKTDPVMERLQRAAVVVARLVPDPVIQARLLERAHARAHDRGDQDRPSEREPRRGRNRER